MMECLISGRKNKLDLNNLEDQKEDTLNDQYTNLEVYLESILEKNRNK